MEQYGNLRVTTVTKGTVYPDGTRQGAVRGGTSASLTDLSTGSHSVEMRYTDGEKETKTVTVQKKRTASMAFTYKPMPIYKIGDRGTAGGWIFYDKGSYSDGGSSTATTSIRTTMAGSSCSPVRPEGL